MKQQPLLEHLSESKDTHKKSVWLFYCFSHSLFLCLSFLSYNCEHDNNISSISFTLHEIIVRSLKTSYGWQNRVRFSAFFLNLFRTWTIFSVCTICTYHICQASQIHYRRCTVVCIDSIKYVKRQILYRFFMCFSVYFRLWMFGK